MFLSKNGIIFFLLAVTGFCSCSYKKGAQSAAKTDTSILAGQIKRYDSISSLYARSYDISLLRSGGNIADSVLSNVFQQLDSSFKKKYLNVLLYRAADLNDLKDYIKSRDFFEKYIFLYQQINPVQPASLAYAQMVLGNIYSRYGDYKKAISLLQQSLKYYSGEKYQDDIAVNILNLAIPLKELQHYDDAAAELQKIFLLTTVSNKRKGRACIELANVFVRQNKITEAGLEIQKAKRFLVITPYNPGDPDRADAYTILHSIEGDWLMAINKPQDAMNTYQRSLDSARISSGQNLRNREIGKTYIAMGKALEEMNYFDSALRFYSRALYTVTNIDTSNNFSLPRQKDLYAENTIAEALLARASCITSHGSGNMKELENAVSCYDLAFETEKKLLNAFSNDESRLYMLEETRKHTREAIAICYRLHQKTNDIHWANQAFLFAESNKSFVLNESVKRNIAASLFMQQDPLFTQMQSLQSRLASLEIELNKQKFSSAPDTVMVSKLLADKRALEETLLQNESAIRISNPQYSNWLSNDDRLPADRIISSIAAGGSALVEYFVDDSVVYLFSAAEGKQLSFTKLSPGIKEACSSFLSFFSDRNIILNKPAEYAAAANRLYQLLSIPGSTSLTIIPDGFISLIPFDALLTGPSTSTNISSFPFLLKQAEISYAFSCRTILMQQQFKNKAGDDNLIAFAPVFANRERGFIPLLHSTEELEAIKEFYPNGKYFSNTAATLQHFKTDCSNASIIHLATHAGAGNDSSFAGIEFYDSTLYLNHIYSLPVKAKLVVLSGCETGAGNVNKTEGLMSLARGFSYAGTQNVVAGLWQTEDKTSGELFKSFYSSLSSNTISGSLRNAKLKLIQNASVSQASPFYWAGYICIGIPGEKISRNENEDRPFIYISILLLLVGVFMVFKKEPVSTR